MAESIIKNSLYGDNGAWLNINGNYLKCSKKSGMVTIYGESNGTAIFTGGVWNNIGTLPEGYRPSAPFNFTFIDRVHVAPCWGQVTDAGTVRAYGDAGGTFSYWVYSATFPVVDE